MDSLLEAFYSPKVRFTLLYGSIYEQKERVGEHVGYLINLSVITHLSQ